MKKNLSMLELIETFEELLRDLRREAEVAPVVNVHQERADQLVIGIRRLLDVTVQPIGDSVWSWWAAGLESLLQRDVLTENGPPASASAPDLAALFRPVCHCGDAYCTTVLGEGCVEVRHLVAPAVTPLCPSCRLILARAILRQG